MLINSKDLISRTTQNSARGLLIVSGTLILIERHSLDPNNWNLLNGDVQASVFFEATLVLVLFLSASLIIHWRGDYVAYRKWFKSNEVSMGTMWGNSSPKGTEPTIDGLKRRLGWLSDETNRLDAAAKKFESYCEPEGSASSGQQVSQKLDETVRLAHETREAIKSMQSNLDSLNTLLDELETRFEDTGFWARFEVFVWYLLLPLGVAILSVWPIVARTFG